MLQSTLKVEAESSGVLGNFLTIASSRTQDVLYSIFGDYGYQPKNSFSFSQKQKMLSYLQAKVFTRNSQLQEAEPLRFIDYNEHFLDSLPDSVEGLKNKVLKGRTNLQAAEKSLEKMKQERDLVTIKYLNEQAYEFDRSKYHSMGWGFLLGSLINVTLYKRGNAIRKAALALAFGHFFGVFSYFINVDRYFDSVYPVFEADAVTFSNEEKETLDWKPQGKGHVEE